MDTATSAEVRSHRAMPSLPEALIGGGTALSIALIAFSSGGYFPTAWGWGALLALTIIAGYLVLATPTRPAALALVWLGGLLAFAAWTWLGLLWTENTSGTVLEGQRTLLYIAAVAALVLLVRRATVPLVLGSILVAIFLVAGYGLLTRLFPERLGVFDPVAAYRLEEPLTYWNALGIFATIGAILALGFAARAQTLLVRVLASATLPVFFATIYFTFSRGSWVAAGIGLGVAIAVDPRRLQLLLTGLVLAPVSALAVLISSHQDALTRTDAPSLDAASQEGHRLAVYLLALVGVSALVGAALVLAERRVVPGRPVRLAFGGALALVAVASLLAVFVRYGGPVALAHKGYDAFTTTSGGTPVDLNKRLFSFSGSYRSELWHEAWDDYKAHPVLGSGPGSYEQYWNKHRPIQHKVRDAHNLYLEVLAELGPIGLLFLLLALGVPLAAGIAARGHPLVPLALAAYSAFLVHAAVDWDWEMSAVTLTALGCAAAMIAAADRRDPLPLLSPRTRAVGTSVAILLAVVAFVGVIGASAIAASERARDKGSYGEARSQARKAARWERWSPDPWRLQGDIQSAQGDLAGAQASYRKAISKNKSDWKLWYDLSSVSEGAEAQSALAQATRLNRYASEDFEAGDVPG